METIRKSLNRELGFFIIISTDRLKIGMRFSVFLSQALHCSFSFRGFEIVLGPA